MTLAHEKLLNLWLSRRSRIGEQLVAFVAPTKEKSCEPQELRRWLGDRLPYWMIPSEFVCITEFPRTPSGKVDRLALIAHSLLPPPVLEVVLPRTPIEIRLTDMFTELLGVCPNSIHDDFFSHLGGHSLLATQLASTIRQEWRIDFPLRVIFEMPTIAGIAVYLQQNQPSERKTTSVIPRRTRP